MSPLDKDLGSVWDMYNAASQAMEFSKDKAFQDYHDNKMMRLAIERLLEIMGQAAKEVSLEFRQQYADVPWPK